MASEKVMKRIINFNMNSKLQHIKTYWLLLITISPLLFFSCNKQKNKISDYDIPLEYKELFTLKNSGGTSTQEVHTVTDPPLSSMTMNQSMPGLLLWEMRMEPGMTFTIKRGVILSCLFRIMVR